MHSKLAEAVVSMPLMRLGLGGLWSTRQSPLPNFGSALFQRWAGRMEAVCLSHSMLSCPGLPDFLAAVKHNTVVRLQTSSLIEAGQADRMLHKCTVRRLELAGGFLPSCLPSTVTELQVSFWEVKAQPRTFQSDQCNAFLYRVDKLPQLTSLSLRMCANGPIVLRCPVRLAQLQVLHVEVHDLMAEIDLSWVHLQACPAFDCTVRFSFTNQGHHDAVLVQLQPVAIRTLSLCVAFPFSCDLQEMWSQLVVRSLHLHLLEDVLSSASGALQFLPISCTHIVIESSAVDQVIYVRWAALIRQAANIRLITKPCATVQILGAGHACLADVTRLQQPWQLVVHGAQSVYGLPAPLASDKTYFQQNAAACSADWTSETE